MRLFGMGAIFSHCYLLRVHKYGCSGAGSQAAHTSRLALLSSALYVPAGVALCALAYTSMRFNERNLHCFISLGFSGAAFMCVNSTNSLSTHVMLFKILVMHLSSLLAHQFPDGCDEMSVHESFVHPVVCACMAFQRNRDMQRQGSSSEQQWAQSLGPT